MLTGNENETCFQIFAMKIKVHNDAICCNPTIYLKTLKNFYFAYKTMWADI